MPRRSAGINGHFVERTDLPPTSSSTAGLGAVLELSRALERGGGGWRGAGGTPCPSSGVSDLALVEPELPGLLAELPRGWWWALVVCGQWLPCWLSPGTPALPAPQLCRLAFIVTAFC